MSRNSNRPQASKRQRQTDRIARVLSVPAPRTVARQTETALDWSAIAERAMVR